MSRHSKSRVVPKRYIIDSGYSVCFLAQVDIKNPTSEQQRDTHPGQDEAVAETAFTRLTKVL